MSWEVNIETPDREGPGKELEEQWPLNEEAKTEQ